MRRIETENPQIEKQLKVARQDHATEAAQENSTLPHAPAQPTVVGRYDFASVQQRAPRGARDRAEVKQVGVCVRVCV